MTRSRLLVGIAAAVALGACSSQPALEDIPTGREVLVETADGRLVAGRLVETRDDQVVLERRDGGRTALSRDAVAAVGLTDETRDDSGVTRTRMANESVAYRELTVPEGTKIRVTLDAAVASDTSRVEDRVSATLGNPVVVDGVEVVPSGSRLVGTITDVRVSGKVKGRARLAFRFETLTVAGGGERLDVATRPVEIEAAGTKEDDAKKIGIPAAAGAVIGGIIGGGKGAATGALIGGGAGTAVVLTTKGNEVRLNAGTPLDVRLQQSLTFQVRTDRQAP